MVAKRGGARSPCINICGLDATGQLCLSCFRSIDEISTWCMLSDEQRREVLRDLPRRRRSSRSENAKPAGPVA